MICSRYEKDKLQDTSPVRLFFFFFFPSELHRCKLRLIGRSRVLEGMYVRLCFRCLPTADSSLYATISLPTV